MGRYRATFIVLFATAILVGCDSMGNRRDEQQQATTNVVDGWTIEVTDVTRDDVPELDEGRTYVYRAGPRPDDPKAIVVDLLDAGFPVTQAWMPLDDQCFDPIGARFVVALAVPDARMLANDFEQGSGRLFCASQLRQYTVKR